MKKTFFLAAALLFLSVSVIDAQYITKPVTYVLPCGTFERQERIIDIVSDPNYLTNRWDELNEELCGDDSQTPAKEEGEVAGGTAEPAV
ncbi:MAG TPA: hypothetical protein IAB87_05425 [Candidatus Coprenecus merdipullorum]|nr:hypothetical protein [Candidatus Coprenecus merdipullorum]